MNVKPNKIDKSKQGLTTLEARKRLIEFGLNEPVKVRQLIGKIAVHLTEKTPETEFEKGTRDFGFLIMRVVFFLVIFAFLLNTLLHPDTLESLLFSIALAVGLTPKFLPMITTITLGQGALKMAKEKVIVKHLEAIQNFGSIDILCSDKTGTLTTCTMSLREHTDAFGENSEW